LNFSSLDKTRARNAAKLIRSQSQVDMPDAHVEILKSWSQSQLRSGIVATYLPIQSEINPGPLSKALVEAGCELALPCIKRKAQPLEFRRFTPGDKLRGGPYNTREPLKSAEIVDPDIVLLPLLAFSKNGYRLGYGGGFYDRSLVALRAKKQIFACGLAYAAQEVPRVPTDEYDQKLDGVLTEREFRKF